MRSLAQYLGMGNYLLLLGLALFAWVVWRNRGLSLRSLLVFLAGWLGFVIMDEGPSRLLVVTSGALIAVGGAGLGLSLRKQASVQFDPSMDRSAGT